MLGIALKMSSHVKNVKSKEDSSAKVEPNRRGRQVVLAGIAGAIPLAFKIGRLYLGFKMRAKKAGKIFKKELIANGIDKKMAREMTVEYMKTSHFLSEFNFSTMRNGRK